MWTTLAYGTSVEEFQAYVPPMEELPKGTPVKLTVRSSLPIGPLGDMVGAELLAPWFLDYTGAELVDVEGTAWDTIVVHMVADPIWLVPLIAGLTIVITSVIGLVILMHLEAIIPEIPKTVQWVAAAIIGVAAVVGLGIITRKRREHGVPASRR